MPSLARNRFESNKVDVERLMEIHEELVGSDPGRKHNIDVINRAAIVFVCACWESFVEDLASEALDYLVQNSSDAKSIPKKLKALVYNAISLPNPQVIWDALADGGWKSQLISRKAEILENWLGKFHTPSAENVTNLFEELLGLRDVSLGWKWKNMSKERARKKLDELVKIRGDIAHRTVHVENVHKSWTRDYLGHIATLASKTEIAVAKHLESSVGSNPWPTG